MSIATDPPVSEKQRRAMFAAASGNSTLGIPKRVGKEFVGKDMNRTDWRGFINGFIKFLKEESKEPEHTEDSTPKQAAGVAFITPDGKSLFLKRSGEGDHKGEWNFPGGMAEEGEDWEDCARREVGEEVGEAPTDNLKPLDHRKSEDANGVDFVTYSQPIEKEFEPKLNDEHTEYKWAPLNDPPQPLHPGVKATLDMLVTKAKDDTTLDSWSFDDWSPEAREAAAKARHIHMSASHESGGGKKFTARASNPNEVEQHLKTLHEHVKNNKLGAHNVTIHNTKSGVAHSAKVSEHGIHGFNKQAVEDAKPRKLISYRRPGKDAKVAAFDHGVAMDHDTVRSYDKDGRLHVGSSHISKATVNPYWGREIPDYEKLNLNPDKKYNLLRHPDELAKATPTFNNLPVLRKHVPATAEQHPHEDVIGSTGTDAEYQYPYLDNSLVFWPKDAIDDIENGGPKQLSCAYRYTADMTPGEYEGQKYDGVMRNIIGNHVALVKEGRAGADVVVGDRKFKTNATDWKTVFSAKQRSRVMKFSPKALVTKGALTAYLVPRLATDHQIAKVMDFGTILEGTTAKNFNTKKAIIESCVRAAVRGKLAADADIEDLADLLDALADHDDTDEVDMDALENNGGLPYGTSHEGSDTEPDETLAKVKEFLKDKVSPEVIEQLDAFTATDEETDEEKERRMMMERRGLDARNALGRDETEEERDARERRESAQDARNSLGRDETEEERKEREANDKKARDARFARAARDAKKAVDAKKAKDVKNAKDNDPDEGDKKAMDGKYVTREAMDEAIATATKAAVKQTLTTQREIREAEEVIRPYVGKLALDEAQSPTDVYRKALVSMGINTSGIHPTAFRAILEAQPKPGGKNIRLGQDEAAPDSKKAAAANKDFHERFPGVARIGRV